MNRILLVISLFLIGTAAHSQNLSGQWKGEFIDKSTKYMGWGGETCEYVLDIEVKGTAVTGFSYTYFTEAGKRYYTICRLEGSLNRKSKSIEIKEVERTKTNIPAEVLNCFQEHKLSYYKKTDGEESLEGKWSPASDKETNCGYGVTTLRRRSLSKTFPGLKNNLAKQPTNKSFNDPRSIAPAKVPSKPLQKTTTAASKPNPVAVPTKPALVNSPAITKSSKDSEQVVAESQKPTAAQPSIKKISPPSTRFEKRTNTVLKTIEIESESVVIDLYDNGEVDGDSVSLFFNGKLVIARKKLTTQPLRFRISQEELAAENELVMYAENLGTIPPNTALMVVTDGTKRYEVRITSDLQKSGTIRFLKKQQ